MTRFPFVACFLDQSMPIGEQDREWVACFYVIASDAESAKKWGDTVANAHCAKRPNLLVVRSYIDNDSVGWTASPAVAYGEMPTDEKIGW
jgi:hypothetical protein